MTVLKLAGFLEPPARRLIAMILLVSPSATALVVRWRLEVLTCPSRPASIRATAFSGSKLPQLGASLRKDALSRGDPAIRWSP